MGISLGIAFVVVSVIAIVASSQAKAKHGRSTGSGGLIEVRVHGQDRDSRDGPERRYRAWWLWQRERAMWAA